MVVVSAGVVACGLMMIGSVGPNPAGADSLGELICVRSKRVGLRGCIAPVGFHPLQPIGGGGQSAVVLIELASQ